ncbi:sugar phosphate isomerase/epimerase family protein [Kineococcus gynurae]|uniref:Sugar phosphate isomerase/epimerase family protein n=1 Tax=Kineococcus gynurae TaxID=452979 RepID=A0ABV5LWK6_9ACTN
MSTPGTLSVQVYSVRDAYAADPAAALQRLRDIGFRHVEPFGLGEAGGAAKATALRAHLDAAGLKASAVHASLPEDLDELVEQLRTLDVDTVFVPVPAAVHGFADKGFDSGVFDDADTLDAFTDALLQAAATLRGSGISLGYHNHWWEWAELPGGQLGYDRFWDRAGDGLLAELDVYWARAAGQDPAQVLARLGSRAASLHLKDGPAVPDQPQGPFGSGVVDVPGAIAATGARWHVAEVDTTDGDPFDLIAGNVAALREQGLSDF